MDTENTDHGQAEIDSGDEVAMVAAADEPAVEEEIAAEEEEEDSIGIGWLLAAGLALIAVPVLIGFIFLTGGDDSSSDGSGSANTAGDMGGSVGGDIGGGILNFSQIQASDPFVTSDGSGSAAVLRVTTSIEAACAVAYGPTNVLGSLATDTDMAGGGHTNHAPVMTGLQPGTTYFYRIMGVGPDGRIYQSDLRSFTFDPGETDASAAPPDVSAAPAVEPPAPNVASMASVTDVSSEFSAAYGGRNAVDGDLSTEWSSAGDGDDAYIVLDFGETMVVKGVGFRTREMSDGTSITTSFTVTVDGTPYGPFEAGPGLAVGLAEFSGQVIRFDVETSTGGNTGAVEVEVYGETDM